jgi:hypothetical protein
MRCLARSGGDGLGEKCRLYKLQHCDRVLPADAGKDPVGLAPSFEWWTPSAIRRLYLEARGNR